MPRKKKAIGRPRKYKTEAEAIEANREKARLWQKTHKGNNREWMSANAKQVFFRWNVEADKDIIEKLGTEPNKAQYIRGLIREDIRQSAKAGRDKAKEEYNQ